MSHPASGSLSLLEKLRRQRYQQCQQQVIEQQQVVTDIQTKIEMLQQFIHSPGTSITDGLALRNLESYTQELRRLLTWQQQQSRVAEQELVRRKALVIESHRHAKQLESYREALSVTEQQQRQRQAQKNTDALAALRFTKKG